MDKKYLTSGKEGLIDRRGQYKTEEELSETEKLERKNVSLRKGKRRMSS